MENKFEKFSKLLFLGPKGSYSEFATQKFSQFCLDDCEFLMKESIYKIVQSLIESTSDSVVAILPIENSVEGIVRETQDSLRVLAENGIKIFAETKIPIEHSLIGFASDKNQIETVVSHPQAIAQCREFLNSNFNGNLKEEFSFSTSSGVASLTPEFPKKVAIGSEYSAKVYNVPILESKINDEKNNTTRFVLLSKFKPPKQLQNKISIVFSTENKFGALNKALSVLEKYELNLSYIDSRPSRKELGEYVFYADFEGYIEDNNVCLALLELLTITKEVCILSEGAIIY